MAGDSSRRRPLAAVVLATSVGSLAGLASCSIVTSFDGFVGADGSSTSDASFAAERADENAPSESASESGGDDADSAAAPDADARSGDSTTGDTGGAVGDASRDEGAPADAFGPEGGADAPATVIDFVQAAAASPSGTASSVGVTFAQAQGAGNLIVVAVGWTGNSSTGVMQVSDSIGNGYAPAMSPTHISAGLSLALYYARAIMAAPAGGNTVTIAFTTAVGPVEVVAAEYSGLDPVAPFDTGFAFGGRGTTAGSSNVTTATAPELLVGAGITQGSFTGAGSLFTLRKLAGSGIGLIEDRVVSAAGAYSADAPIASSAYYIMQVAAFR